MLICSINSKKKSLESILLTISLKKVVTHYKRVGYSMYIIAAVCMPGYKSKK